MAGRGSKRLELRRGALWGGRRVTALLRAAILSAPGLAAALGARSSSSSSPRGARGQRGDEAPGRAALMRPEPPRAFHGRC